MSSERIVLLACPYGQVGGGMGSIMTTWAVRGTDPSGRYRLQRLESRGPGSILLSPLFLLKACFRIFYEASRHRLAVVHLNLAERGSIYRKGLLLALSRLLGVPVLVHLHAAQIISDYETMGWFRSRILVMIFQSANRIIVLGDLWRHWLNTKLNVPHRSIQIVRNGVPACHQRARPRQVGQPLHILFLGNLLGRKGLSDLLNALPAVIKHGHEFLLTVSGGGDIKIYQDEACNLGIGDRVRFTGWVDKDTARSLILDANILVLPSYDEALPLVILEALAAGLPVICSPVGAIPEVFTNRHTAFFVAPGDRDGLTQAILELATDADLWNILASAGKALYEREFTLEVFAERLSQIYIELDTKIFEPRTSPVTHLKANASD